MNTQLNLSANPIMDHHKRVLEAVGRQNVCEIFVAGNDKIPLRSKRLWILSPFVRNIIDSLGNITNNYIILPDFSQNEIENFFHMTDGDYDKQRLRATDDRCSVHLNRSFKHLMDTLCINVVKEEKEEEQEQEQEQEQEEEEEEEEE